MTHPSDPRPIGPHRHHWNQSGGRFEEGAKRTCLRCKQQQIKTRGRWMPVEELEGRPADAGEQAVMTHDEKFAQFREEKRAREARQPRRVTWRSVSEDTGGGWSGLGSARPDALARVLPRSGGVYRWSVLVDGRLLDEYGGTARSVETAKVSAADALRRYLRDTTDPAGRESEATSRPAGSAGSGPADTRKEDIMARKNTQTTTPAQAQAQQPVDVRQLIVDGLTGKGLAVEVALMPSGAGARLMLDGKNVAYVDKQTRNGVKVTPNIPQGKLPKAVKGFTERKSATFSYQALIDEKQVPQAVAAVEAAAQLLSEARAAKEAAKAQRADAKATGKLTGERLAAAEQAEAVQVQPDPKPARKPRARKSAQTALTLVEGDAGAAPDVQA